MHTSKEAAGRLQVAIKRDGLGAGILDVDLRMILKVLSDTRKIDNNWNVEGGEFVGRSHTRSHKDCWCFNSASGQHNLPSGPDRLAPASVNEVDTNCSIIREHDPFDDRICKYSEVAERTGRKYPTPNCCSPFTSAVRG